MREVSQGALDAGGEVIGVIPHSMVEREWGRDDLTQVHVVETMHQRKQAFTDLSDGFVTLPGGTGTMDELWEALSWSQLGYHAKPVGLLNADRYYDGLVAFWSKMAEVGFLRPQHLDGPRLIMHSADHAPGELLLLVPSPRAATVPPRELE